MAILDTILNPILLPLMSWNPALGIILVSFVLSVLMTYIYKKVTNQDKMKELKEKQQEYQKKMKELRNNPEEMLKVQKESMSLSKDYMMHSLKPTLYTFLPLLLIFGWMAGHLVYEPIWPGDTYSITATFMEGIEGEIELIVDESTTVLNNKTQTVSPEVQWKLKSDSGTHLVRVVKNNVSLGSMEVLISKQLEYTPEKVYFKHSDLESLQINYNKLKPLSTFSIFGWYPGWLAIYIISSLIFNMSLRKMFKIY
jgi:uncharacterized membrane protein (DUF106 family)